MTEPVLPSTIPNKPLPIAGAPTFKEIEQRARPVSFRTLLRYATRKDKTIMVIGIIAAILEGAALPGFSILFGDVIDEFAQPGGIISAAAKLCGEFLGIGVAAFILSYISFASWMITGETQAIAIRKQYFRSLLRQEIAFFDSVNPNELASKIAEECFSIQGGIGEKVSTFVYSLSLLIFGFLVGYIMGWQLALVLTAIMPAVAGSGTAFVYTIQKQTAYTSKSYATAGGISEEALNSIKTVVALGGEPKEVKRYQDALDKHNKSVVKFALISGFAMGLMIFMFFGMYALAFWFGGKLIDNQTTNAIKGEPYTGGDVLTVFFSIMFGGFSISQATPAIKKFAVAKAAGGRAFALIDRQSKISIEDPNGLRPDTITGRIAFNNVTFAYPLKPDRTILKGVSFSTLR